MTEANSRFRLTVVGFVVFALFTALFARLWFLQVGSSQSYAAQTERNRIRMIQEPADPRVDRRRNGTVLVQNTLVDTITVKRGLTPEERAITVQNLARVLAVTPESIDAELDSPKYSVVRAGADRQERDLRQLVYIKEHPELFPGAVSRRCPPSGRAFASTRTDSTTATRLGRTSSATSRRSTSRSTRSTRARTTRPTT